jgi:hypothetical protein
MDNISILQSTINETGTPGIYQNNYEKYTGLFWAYAVITLFVALIAVTGNGFVLFITYGNRNSGRLRYLDNAIKSLAVADMLIGLIGIPCRIVVYYFRG